MGNAKNTVKRGASEGRRQGVHAPFSFGEGDAYGKATASRGHEGPWPDLRAYAQQPARGPTKGKGEGGVGTIVAVAVVVVMVVVVVVGVVVLLWWRAWLLWLLWVL